MRRNIASPPPSPDFAKNSNEIAVFADGCFWHGHRACALVSKKQPRRILVAD